ncbi:probable receptor-like protein kinase At5g24010 [Rutidosis leptorrhynchoides]|uniref:probable receptor-like protein kinase At5g24010 n=1 Tax=Rutidosis leptorrhynchoides TaxID=125765 RepID=UPI003A9A23B3
MAAFFEQFKHLKIQLEDIKLATNNFSDNNLLGKGGFGNVYKGSIRHSKGQEIVAFKRLDGRYGQGNSEFWREIMMLSRYTHKNLISLLGYCDEAGEKILVYELASHRSLNNHLSDPTLVWKQRLQICLASAKGLNYLHDPKGLQQRVLHRDIKSSNILLDENWTPKISDLGLSKMGPANQRHTVLITNTVGTLGYLDPQYLEIGMLTKESDVYSFGVVLFEVLCGKLCFGNKNGQFQSSVRMWKKCYKYNKLDEIIFQDLKQQMGPRSLETFSDIAYQCVQEYREERPPMSLVVKKLERALEFQEIYESRNSTIVSPSGSGSGRLNDENEDGVEKSYGTVSPLAYSVSPNETVNGSFKNWLKGDLIGKGTFTTVYEGFTDSGFFFAVKDVSLLEESFFEKQNLVQLEQVISLLSQLQHENIVRYFGTDTDDGKLYIFLELVSKSSLAKLYQKYHLRDSQVSAYTRQILSGLNYLHKRKVFHGDIKCANILVDVTGSIKLADFGLGKETLTLKSSPYWMAPEVVNNRSIKGYGLAADIWSLGCTVLEILTRRIPYSPMEEMQALIRIGRGELPEIPNTLSAEAHEFILKCLQVNPNNRPTAAQLLDLPFLKRATSMDSS